MMGTRRSAIINYERTAPGGVTWFILDVMRKGDEHRPFRRGRPRNEWVAILIDIEPDIFCSGSMPTASSCSSCWLDLGRHTSRETAWDHAGSMIATRH